MIRHLKNQDLVDKGSVVCFACGEPATNRYSKVDTDIFNLTEAHRWRCDKHTPVDKGFFDLDYDCYGKGA